MTKIELSLPSDLWAKVLTDDAYLEAFLIIVKEHVAKARKAVREEMQ